MYLFLFYTDIVFSVVIIFSTLHMCYMKALGEFVANRDYIYNNCHFDSTTNHDPRYVIYKPPRYYRLEVIGVKLKSEQETHRSF
jgi:hypothetical protein